MPIHIIPTRISTAGKTLNSIIPINPTSAAYQMIKLTAAAKVPSEIAQTMRIYHSDAYAKELKLETVLTKMSKFTIYSTLISLFSQLPKCHCTGSSHI